KGVGGYSYAWQAPLTKGNKSTLKVRIKAFDALGKSVGTDVSDGAFSVVVIALDSPNGGETLTSNAQTTIDWTTHATSKPVARVKLQYSITGGSGWKTIATINGNPGTYDWTVPVVTASRPMSKIRITLQNSQGAKLGTDDSNAVFTINP